MCSRACRERLREIPGVADLYLTSQPGGVGVIVRFFMGVGAASITRVSEVVAEDGTNHTGNRGNICTDVAGTGNEMESQLVLVQRVREDKPSVIGDHKVLPDERYIVESRRRRREDRATQLN
jgi:hypothetical protein